MAKLKSKTAAQYQAEIDANLAANEADYKLQTFYTKADAIAGAAILGLPESAITPVTDRFGRGTTTGSRARAES